MTDLLKPTRRGLFTGFAGLLATPAIVRVASIMPIFPERALILSKPPMLVALKSVRIRQYLRTLYGPDPSRAVAVVAIAEPPCTVSIDDGPLMIFESISGYYDPSSRSTVHAVTADGQRRDIKIGAAAIINYETVRV